MDSGDNFVMYLIKRLLQVKKIDQILWGTQNILNHNYADYYSYIYQDEENLRHLRELKNLLIVKDVKKTSSGEKWIRVGGANDGGYVMLNDFQNVKVAYSLGIGNNVSWDYDLAERGMDIYMYDHTIKKVPQKHARFHWEKKGICGDSEGSRENMDSLENFIRRNGHKDESNMLLKMDIEGGEWDVFSTISSKTLKQFDQIVCEFHSMYRIELLEIIKECLKKLNETHQLVHVHANNNCSILKTGNFIMPQCLEVTYINKTGREFTDSDRFFPTPVDQKNSSFGPDIPLGYWNTPVDQG